MTSEMSSNPNNPTVPVTVAYTPRYLDWQLGTGHPTNPERARIVVDQIITWAATAGVDLRLIRPELDLHRMLQEAGLVHDHRYLTDLHDGLSDEWSGSNLELRDTAAVMFQGTVDLVEDLLAEWRTGIWFNPQGAKHHAMRDRSGGFCVLNDMAWAARRLVAAGKKVMYVDWDAHHGDGVEALLADTPGILTCSIHDGTIFPGTGKNSRPKDGVHNWSLAAGSDDTDLAAAMHEILDLAYNQGPDVILLACGADGLAGDPLSTLKYSLEGIGAAARSLGFCAADIDIPVIVGGAGGYQPLTETPAAWTETIRNLHEALMTPEVVDSNDPWVQFCRNNH
ncbi:MULTISPECIES: histone deacetylase family protein [unclassified Nocardioides]|uniref:histone deacetylase family protein n=1 Tax=unclassified Nocardioides TaxID=2615069 RepID=UPI0006FC7DED|nr:MULTISPECIES: hypothetical protein [unclassified Nocardioides]KRA37901.1 hypothetical protein ASD81_04245 [Nocardioides sp. Root614]KRA91861.1 hypothetical protein ASD84_04510 [Nocardioides sp. Root682]